VPELISYCNKLIYSGRLEPKRPSIEAGKRILPAFGYLSVAGRDVKVGNSRRNDDEAKAIVKWLKSNRELIERHYVDDETGMPTPLWQVVGVVTPFKPQANTIERVLRKEMPDLMRKDSKLTVGTVHALQGAERAIVIFSPTYGESFTGGAFFDQKPNMLNVAVSRAKDSFLVFGNLALFDAAKTGRPSGLLATYLFHGDSSAI
jgi:superfamily I DNA and/or RNA helicase